MYRLPFALRFLAACAMLTACGGDKPSPSGPPTPGTPVATVELTPTTPHVVVGRTLALAAIARDANGNTLAGKSMTWASASASIATVDAAGVVTGVAVGSTRISVTSEGKSAEADLIVDPIEIATITIAPDTTVLKVSETKQFVAVVKDNAGNVMTGVTLKWSTSSATVAQVDSATGMVAGQDDGLATITATAAGKSGTSVARVYSPVASVSVSAAPDTLEAWDVRQMEATLKDAKGRTLTGRTIVWTVSDTSIASLKPAGEFTGIDRGTVTVTATSEGISGSAKRVVVIKYRSISAGTMHACDIASGGIVWCWGLNGLEGRVGMAALGTTVSTNVPVRVSGDRHFVQLSTFGRHACAIKVDGSAYCWGSNGAGQLGAAAGAFSATPVAVSGGIVFKQITTAAEHSCGLDAAGRAYCWGQNGSGELGDGTRTLRNAPVAVSGGLIFTTIAAGGSNTCGVTADGSIYCWGANALGALGNGGTFGGTATAPSKVIGLPAMAQVSVGTSHVCGLSATGQGYCWGAQAASGAPTQTSTPLAMAGALTMRSQSSGFAHDCGITTLNDVYCWGHNGGGQLGVAGSGTNQPVRAGGSLKVIEVSAAGVATGSGAHTCAISPDRLTVYCWGQNDTGQLGNGAYTAASVTNPVPSIVVSQKPLQAN